jgi:hypothetical protein
MYNLVTVWLRLGSTDQQCASPTANALICQAAKSGARNEIYHGVGLSLAGTLLRSAS